MPGGTSMDDLRSDLTRTQRLATEPRKTAELQRSLADISQLVSDWFWETDAHFRLTWASMRVIEALGYHPQVLVGKRLTDIGQFLSPLEQPVTPDWRSPFRELLFTAESRHQGRVWFLVSGMPVHDSVNGSFYGVRGTARDVTEMRRSAEALRASEERLALMVAASRDAIFDWDLLSGRAFFSSSWAMRMGLAMERGTIRMDDWHATIHAADRYAVMQALASGLRDDVPFELPDHRVRTAEGDYIWIATQARTVQRNQRGASVRVTGAHRDITRRKGEEELLKKATEEADRARRAKSEFLATMSHELRTPLNSIIGFSDILANETFGSVGRPEYREYARDINDSGRHLLAIISDILDVTRIEANGLQLVESACDVKLLLGACVRVVAERAAKAGIELVREIPDDLPTLYADERRVRQIMLNLLSNGLKFTPRGGRVAVGARSEASGALVLWVADNGIGVAESDIERVMAPFRQADGSLARHYEGVGLGLTLSKSLAELHGGTLTLSSRLGEGTTAAVVFPPQRVLPPARTEEP